MLPPAAVDWLLDTCGPANGYQPGGEPVAGLSALSGWTCGNVLSNTVGVIHVCAGADNSVAGGYGQVGLRPLWLWSMQGRSLRHSVAVTPLPNT